MYRFEKMFKRRFLFMLAKQEQFFKYLKDCGRANPVSAPRSRWLLVDDTLAYTLMDCGRGNPVSAPGVGGS